MNALSNQTAVAISCVALCLGALPAHAEVSTIISSPEFGSNPLAPQVVSERIAGADRLSTAIAITQKLYKNNDADIICLASGEAFPDAISATSLVTQIKAPLLLTSRAQMSSEVMAEIKRLAKPNAQVLLLGGTQAINPKVDAQLKQMGLGTKRLAGPTRVETALAIADEQLRHIPNQRLEHMVISDGDAFGSSIAAAATSARLWGIHLLNVSETNDQLHPAVQAWITKNKPKVIISADAKGERVIEAPRVIHISLKDQVNTQDCTINPACTPNARYAKSPDQAIAEQLMANYFSTSGHFVFVSGVSYVDGLAAGQLAAKQDAPILPIMDPKNNDGRQEYNRYVSVMNLMKLRKNTFTFIGGDQAIAKEVVDSLSTARQHKHVQPE